MILFQISDEDARIIAKEEIKCELIYEELERVQKGLEFGLECWDYVMRVAINEVVDDC